MDVKSIVLISVGILTIGAMIWMILKDTPKENEKQSGIDIRDDQSESVYETVEEKGGDESIFDS
jgi:hypothetical protein